jgi:hypothetical protein
MITLFFSVGTEANEFIIEDDLQTNIIYKNFLKVNLAQGAWA